MSDVVHAENVVEEAKSEAAGVTLPLPRASVLVVVMSLVVLLACAVLVGFLWQQALRRDPSTGEGPLVALLSLLPMWLAWQQWRGTFRQHERAANDAGNWLIGVAAVLATCLAALPMMAATPLTLEWLAIFGGGCLWAGGSGWLDLAWARRLRRAGWNEEDHGMRSLGWQFSIADMIIWTLLAAGATGSYLQFDRMGTSRRGQPVQHVESPAS